MADAPLLEATGITKRLAGRTALDGVSFAIGAGEIVGLVGENGAGKTTLIKILTGALQPDAGALRFRGQPAGFADAATARAAGVAAVHQDLVLADNLDATANIFLGREPRRRVFGIPVIDRQAMRAGAARLLALLDFELPRLDRPVRQLSGGQRLAVAIGRALNADLSVLAMDEPTVALAQSRRRKLAELIGALKADGVGIVFAAHDLDEIFAVADRIVVLRKGAVAGERATRATAPDEIARLMAGG